MQRTLSHSFIMQHKQDVNYKEQSSGAAYMPLAALPSHDEVVLVQCESRLDVSRFEELLRAALKGAAQVRKERRAWRRKGRV